MLWVTWRQHRVQAWTMIGVFAFIAIYALALGLSTRSSFNADGLGPCLARSGGTACGGMIGSFFTKFSEGPTLPLSWILLIIPGLFGAAAGAPVLGSELGRGTWQLAWTQSVPRRRWLGAKLGIIAAGLVVFGGLITIPMSWAWAPLDEVGIRMYSAPFFFERIVMPSALLCSAAIALLAGFVFRNTIGGMYAGYLAFGASFAAAVLFSAWARPFTTTTTVPCPGTSCAAASTSSMPPVTGHLGDMVTHITHAGTQLVVTYVPASDFWPLQFVIGGFYLAIAAATAGTTFWLLHRRTT